MSLKTMTFNNVCTNELGLVIQEEPAYDYPEKDYLVQHVPGKSGDIVVDTGSYKNTQRAYTLATIFSKEGNAKFEWNANIPSTVKNDNSFINRARLIANWLNNAKGYCRLEDDYETDVYREAILYNSGNLNNILNQASGVKVVFECKPQRYLKDGDITQTITPSGDWDKYAIQNSKPQYNTIPLLNVVVDEVLSNTVTFEFTYGSNVFKAVIAIPQSVGYDNILFDWKNKNIYALVAQDEKVNLNNITSLYLNDVEVKDFIDIFINNEIVIVTVKDERSVEPLPLLRGSIKFNWWFI